MYLAVKVTTAFIRMFITGIIKCQEKNDFKSVGMFVFFVLSYQTVWSIDFIFSSIFIQLLYLYDIYIYIYIYSGGEGAVGAGGGYLMGGGKYIHIQYTRSLVSN